MTPKEEKHKNGYLFDSLMYRYMRAREVWRGYEIEFEDVKPEIARDRFNRDLVRFRQILEEVMPNHD